MNRLLLLIGCALALSGCVGTADWLAERYNGQAHGPGGQCLPGYVMIGLYCEKQVAK